MEAENVSETPVNSYEIYDAASQKTDVFKDVYVRKMLLSYSYIVRDQRKCALK
jgi:hypothetical protein